MTDFATPTVSRLRRTGRLLAIALLCLGALPTAWSGPEDEAAKSIFLVATGRLEGTSFQRTVILMTHMGGRVGTTGLAINRTTDVLLRDAFPNIPTLRESDETLFLGGPVSPGTIFVLQRSEVPVQGMMRLVQDIYFAPGEQILARPAMGPRRAYAGYVGWAPGQLQVEIERGDWRVIRRDPGIVFAQDPNGLWDRLTGYREGNWI